MADKPEPLAKGLELGGDGRPRCFWYGGKEDYQIYHEEEWGMPADADVKLFAQTCLQGLQSGR